MFEYKATTKQQYIQVQTTQCQRHNRHLERKPRQKFRSHHTSIDPIPILTLASIRSIFMRPAVLFLVTSGFKNVTLFLFSASDFPPLVREQLSESTSNYFSSVSFPPSISENRVSKTKYFTAFGNSAFFNNQLKCMKFVIGSKCEKKEKRILMRWTKVDSLRPIEAY